jgi:tight adherence protein B
MTLAPEFLRWLGVALSGLGVLTGILVAASDPSSWPARQWNRYDAFLDRELRFLGAAVSSERVLIGQVVTIGLTILVGLFLEEPLAILVIGLTAAVPPLVLRRRSAQRVLAIESQLDNWLLVLANSLRASPSLGDAIESSTQLVEPPLNVELDVLCKEMRLGTPVDTAVLNLGSHSRSRLVQSALAAILVGRQTGGELSSILEETAGSIREMTRLEAVLRTKTAESRTQAYVLGAIPFFLILALEYIDPRWLDPLSETSMGLVVTAISATLWLGAILLARRILSVDM